MKIFATALDRPGIASSHQGQLTQDFPMPRENAHNRGCGKSQQSSSRRPDHRCLERGAAAKAQYNGGKWEADPKACCESA
ncbi:hypothetical protein [Desulforamulus aquiferis]|uniref:Uncharacterized protein n=1 Tax=Desulforamulus aquiferis TaxID=1397668 RepID=A0AAW7ZF32_9FIRM|nr:hypothetical protein [Desulforamulus aquiferis]MDO7787870.1 hypothetical protein [Desulforamulus aquiferis]